MSDTTGKPSYRLHAVGLPETLLRQPAVGDIGATPVR